MDSFAKDVMSPLLGGDDRAADWIRMARLEYEPAKIPAAVALMSRIAADAKDAEARRRWTHLGHRLDSFFWEWERNGRKFPIYAMHVETARPREGGSLPDHLAKPASP